MTPTEINAQVLLANLQRISPQIKLESSQSPHTSAKAMLFARWQHHLRFCSGFPYARLTATVPKISKWSRIQDSFRIKSKIKSLVVCATPDIPSKFQKDPSNTFWVILLTHRQTNRQTNKVWQKHYLLGEGNNLIVWLGTTLQVIDIRYHTTLARFCKPDFGPCQLTAKLLVIWRALAKHCLAHETCGSLQQFLF